MRERKSTQCIGNFPSQGYELSAYLGSNEPILVGTQITDECIVDMLCGPWSESPNGRNARFRQKGKLVVPFTQDRRSTRPGNEVGVVLPSFDC